jgi:ABC-type molybdenum transport system ATPase subunit/photorepair protein PhrA
MYIHRVVLRGLKTSPDRDLIFWDNWMQTPLRSILITGHNGSGKTTLLRVIVALWTSLGEWLRLGKALNIEQQFLGNILDNVGLVAIELCELIEGKNIWLFVAGNASDRRFLDEISDLENTLFVGEIRQKDGQTCFEPDSTLDWFQTLAQTYERLLVGLNSDLLPNMVYIDAEERQIYAPIIEERPSVYHEPLYQWLVTYKGSSQWEGHLEAMVRNLKVRDPQWFVKTIENINRFLLPGKKITDFDDNLRLRVTCGENNFHYLEELSTGEKQCLLLMFMVSRWQMIGGIVLVDEPDLHLHVSLQRYFIHELEKLVISRHGQLIVTSHSPQAWEEFSYRKRFNFTLEPVP